jgi:abortive infection bacteriophage resistance protein
MKPHLSYDAQLAQLSERGLQINDERNALWYLKTLGYYRLSGYFYPFRAFSADSDHSACRRASNFVAGSTFSQVSDLYEFDQSLRSLTLEATERLEVSIRAKLAYYMGQFDPCAHLKPSLVHPKFRSAATRADGTTARESPFELWKKQHEKLITRSKEDFVRHFHATYEPPIPLWVSIEVWDFGLLSHYFAGLRDSDKLAIARDLGIPRHVLLASWLRTISHIRNICAHHSRLWNRSIVDSPKPPARDEIALLDHLAGEHRASARQRVYGAFAIIQFLLQALGFGDEWRRRLKALIVSFPTVDGIASLAAMGFPNDWTSLDLWQD